MVWGTLDFGNQEDDLKQEGIILQNKGNLARITNLGTCIGGI